MKKHDPIKAAKIVALRRNGYTWGQIIRTLACSQRAVHTALTKAKLTAKAKDSHYRPRGWRWTEAL